MLKEADDLVALRRPADEDILSKLLQDHWAFQSRGLLTSGLFRLLSERVRRLLNLGLLGLRHCQVGL